MHGIARLVRSGESAERLGAASGAEVTLADRSPESVPRRGCLAPAPTLADGTFGPVYSPKVARTALFLRSHCLNRRLGRMSRRSIARFDLDPILHNPRRHFLLAGAILGPPVYN